MFLYFSQPQAQGEGYHLEHHGSSSRPRSNIKSSCCFNITTNGTFHKRRPRFTVIFQSKSIPYPCFSYNIRPQYCRSFVPPEERNVPEYEINSLFKRVFNQTSFVSTSLVKLQKWHVKNSPHFAQRILYHQLTLS